MAELTSKLNAGFSKLPSCSGLLENGKCKWMNIPVCNSASCTYYTKMDSLTKAYERLSSLPEAKQECIAQKYYGGFRPWKGTDMNSRW
jgi:hypothetical protein